MEKMYFGSIDLSNDCMRRDTALWNSRFGNLRSTTVHLICLLFAVLSGCNTGRPNGAGLPNRVQPQIIATTSLVGDMVRTIVGDRLEVRVLMPAGVDPHLYQPTRSDAVDLLYCPLVVYNGLQLEGQFGEVLQKRKTIGHRTFAVSDSLSNHSIIASQGNIPDPHIWMDASLWAICAIGLGEELAAHFPDHAAAFRRSAAEYAEGLRKLDAWAYDSLQTVAAEQRVLVTAHDAFRYFGRRYEVEVYGVQGMSTASEAGIADVNQLVQMVHLRSVPAVFFETSVSKRQVQAIVDGVQAYGKSISADHTLYSDSLGPAGSGAETYHGMMRSNVVTITTALGGAALSNELDNLTMNLK